MHQNHIFDKKSMPDNERAFFILVASEPSLQVCVSAAYVVISVGNRRLSADFATSVETSHLGKVTSAVKYWYLNFSVFVTIFKIRQNFISC